MDIIGTIAIVILLGLVVGAVVLLRKTKPKATTTAPEAVRETKLKEHKEEVQKEAPAPAPAFERVAREEPVYDRMTAPRRQYGDAPSASTSPDNSAVIFGATAVAASTYDSGSYSDSGSSSSSSSSSDSGSSSSFDGGGGNF